MPQPIKPFLKYPGGKSALLPVIRKHFPLEFRTYYEPFIGGGALLFDVKPRDAIIGDVNSELINCYCVVRDKVMQLIEELRSHPVNKDHFYQLRHWDRYDNFSSMCPIKRAARFIYLNKSCFNGLHRVNKKGQFNVPYGYRDGATVFDENLLIAIQQFFISHSIKIYSIDFAETVSTAVQRDFIYLDPPYDTDKSGFTRYAGEFKKPEQERLKAVVDDLNRRGCNFLVSNAKTQFITELYKEYNQITVKAPRAINPKGNKREKVKELLIKNY